MGSFQRRCKLIVSRGGGKRVGPDELPPQPLLVYATTTAAVGTTKENQFEARVAKLSIKILVTKDLLGMER